MIPSIDPARLNCPMVLLDDVVQILTGSDLDSTPNARLTSELEKRTVARILPVQSQFHRHPGIQECLTEEILCRFNIPVLPQPEVGRAALLVHGSIQITPLSPDANVGLFLPSGFPNAARKMNPTLLEFRHETPHPAEHGSVRKFNPTLCHHLHEIPIAQFVAYVPADIEDGNLAVEMPILKKGIEAARERHDRPQVKVRSVYAPNALNAVAPIPNSHTAT